MRFVFCFFFFPKTILTDVRIVATNRFLKLRYLNRFYVRECSVKHVHVLLLLFVDYKAAHDSRGRQKQTVIPYGDTGITYWNRD